MRSKTSKPQIPKREALQLAQEALAEPLKTLETIAAREQEAYVQLSIRTIHAADAWACYLTFIGACYGANGNGELGPAVRMAIIRAYGGGSERNYLKRENPSEARKVD